MHRKAMKRGLLAIAVVLALLLVSGSAGLADFQDGNQLLDACRGNQLDDQAFCYGYLAAVSDVLAYQAVGEFRSCVPRVSLDQLKDIVVPGLEEIPAMRHHGAQSLVAAILSRTYPCSE